MSCAIHGPPRRAEALYPAGAASGSSSAPNSRSNAPQSVAAADLTRTHPGLLHSAAELLAVWAQADAARAVAHGGRGSRPGVAGRRLSLKGQPDWALGRMHPKEGHPRRWFIALWLVGLVASTHAGAHQIECKITLAQKRQSPAEAGPGLQRSAGSAARRRRAGLGLRKRRTGMRHRGQLRHAGKNCQGHDQRQGEGGGVGGAGHDRVLSGLRGVAMTELSAFKPACDSHMR